MKLFSLLIQRSFKKQKKKNKKNKTASSAPEVERNLANSNVAQFFENVSIEN